MMRTTQTTKKKMIYLINIKSSSMNNLKYMIKNKEKDKVFPLTTKKRRSKSQMMSRK